MPRQRQSHSSRRLLQVMVILVLLPSHRQILPQIRREAHRPQTRSQQMQEWRVRSRQWDQLKPRQRNQLKVRQRKNPPRKNPPRKNPPLQRRRRYRWRHQQRYRWRHRKPQNPLQLPQIPRKNRLQSHQK